MKAERENIAVEHVAAPASTGEESGECQLGQLSPEPTSTLVQCRGQFLGYLQRRLGDRDLAEDVLQDFHIRAIIKADQIRDSASTKGWLWTVLKSVLADHFRHQTVERRAQQALSAEWQADGPEEEEGFDRTGCECFYELLPALKSEYAAALSRIDLAEESREDVACALGITPGNMRVRLHRARAALRHALEDSCHQCRMNGCFDEGEMSLNA